MKIALVGLPSAGKSSIINSFVGKRVTASGICRTTTEAKIYKDLKSDDNVVFSIYDLPGIADIEEKEYQFDNIIFDTIEKCDLIIWVSDINKAFITNHEKNEYEKVRKFIENIGLNKGIAVQLIIMLSKANEPINDNKKNKNNSINIKEQDEIYDDENTTIDDIYIKVKNIFPETDVIYFNAYGRALYHPKSSNNLKSFVSKYKPENVNIIFNCKKYVKQIPNISDTILIKHFIKIQFMQIIINSNPDYNEIIKLFNEAFNKLHLIESKTLLIIFLLHDSETTLCANDIFNNESKINISDTLNCLDVDDRQENEEIYKFSNKKESLNMYHCRGKNKNESINMYHCQGKKTSNNTANNEVAKKLSDLNEITYYDETKWNKLATYIKIPLTSKYISIKYIMDNSDMFSKNQIFRLIQIGDYSLHFKLYLYSLPKCTSLPDFNFYKNNIYNMEYYTSGKFINLENNDSLNKKIGKLIYNDTYVQEIKKIRMQAYGEIETTVAASSIQIAYDNYGLFWMPEKY